MTQEVRGAGVRIPVQDSAPTVAFEDAVQFVFDALGDVPEFRRTRGRQIELHGTLALVVLAMMSGHTTYREIETWGKLREETLIPLLGLVRAPSDTTIGRIINGVDCLARRYVRRGVGDRTCNRNFTTEHTEHTENGRKQPQMDADGR